MCTTFNKEEFYNSYIDLIFFYHFYILTKFNFATYIAGAYKYEIYSSVVELSCIYMELKQINSQICLTSENWWPFILISNKVDDILKITLHSTYYHFSLYLIATF